MNFTVGPFNIPSILMAGGISYIVIGIISLFYCKDKIRRKKILNTISNALILSLLVWKISPVFTSYSPEVPFAFLFLPGGPLGELLGFITMILYLGSHFYKDRDCKMLILSIKVILMIFIFQIIFSSLSTKDLDVQIVNSIKEYGIIVDDEKPTILNFWASWCTPCKSEIPELIEFYDMYNDEINFYGINMSRTEQADVKDFIQSSGMTFPNIYDVTGSISSLMEIKSIPTTLIITKVEGRYHIERFSGAVTKETLIKTVY